MTRALTLPRTNPERGGRAYYRLLSWSPDGTRLLLTRADDFDLRALVILELETGRLRELPALSGPSVSLHAAWSPNGRFVAFTSSGTHDALDLFYVIDVASGRPVIQCPKDLRGPPTECPGGTVWAADSRSVFGPGIARYFLDGRRSREVRLPSGTPTPYVATQSGLIYASGRKVYLHSFATQRARLLYASSVAYLSSVLPLARLP